MKTIEKRESAGPQKNPGSRFSFSKLLALTGMTLTASSCSVFKTRPVQEFSDTAAAMKAAKEAQADLIAPVLYREASEWWQKAKAEYKYKNFEQAEEYAIKARKLAEQAEFEVIKNPSQRVEANPEASAPPAPAPTENPAPTESPAPYPYPSPTGTPYERAIVAPPGGGGGGSGGGGTSGGDNSPTHIQVPPPPTP